MAGVDLLHDDDNLVPVTEFRAAFASLRSAKFGTIEVVLSLPREHSDAAIMLQGLQGVYLQFRASEPMKDQASLWETRRWRDEDFYESVGWRDIDGSPILDDHGYPHPSTIRRTPRTDG